MRVASKSSFNDNNLIKLKDQLWIDKQRIAGSIVAKTLSKLESLVLDKCQFSAVELNEIGEAIIKESGGSPTFKGYKGFPAGVCISINKQLVHGIPKDISLKEGDIISFDLGVTYEGAIADSAITCIYGKPKTNRHVELLQATEGALLEGIRAIGLGKRLGCIGKAIYKYGRNKGFSVVNNYGGHGLEWDQPHAAPFVANKSTVNEGIRIVPGLAIAIEPMLVIGPADTYVSNDGWTVMTGDIGAHAEHSIFIHPEYIEIMTWREGSTYPKIIPFKNYEN
jgi:methionyl aminopeptidase